jgi:hypothetical protein
MNMVQLLSGYTFEVTDFQRDYEWPAEKAVALFEQMHRDWNECAPFTQLQTVTTYTRDGVMAFTDQPPPNLWTHNSVKANPKRVDRQM